MNHTFLCHFILDFHHCLNIQKMLLRYRICFVIVLLHAFSLLFFLFHNLFCKIVLLVKRVNHFDRKKIDYESTCEELLSDYNSFSILDQNTPFSYRNIQS